ncbi:MAG TPA: hypothetical protein PK322_12815 [Opitutaceae bacterium]|nr:hypothetical protein [Opitutaceae bacterium]
MIDVEYEPADDGREVGRLPVAVHERLGEADVAVKRTPFEEGGAVDLDRGGLGDREGGGGERGGVPLHGLASAETVHGAVGQFEVEQAARHLREGAQREALVESAGGFRAGGGRRGGGGGGVFGRVHAWERLGAMEGCGR